MLYQPPNSGCSPPPDAITYNSNPSTFDPLQELQSAKLAFPDSRPNPSNPQLPSIANIRADSKTVLLQLV